MAKMQDLDWNNIKIVLAVARAKSLVGAARKLRVNETTVARRISNMEKYLGARIFERFGGSLTPTSTGQSIVLSAERIERDAQELENVVSGADQIVAGTVRLTTVPAMLNHILIPALLELVHRHTELQLEFVADSRDLSLTNRQADIALRLARPTREARALSRRIGQFHSAAYAHSSKQPESLDWVTFEDDMNYLPQAQWISDHTHGAKQNTSLIKVNDGEAIFACVKAGLGKSLLPTVIGDADSDLIRLDHGICVSREIWLVVHPDLRQLARIKAVIDWLVSVIGKIKEN